MTVAGATKWPWITRCLERLIHSRPCRLDRVWDCIEKPLFDRSCVKFAGLIARAAALLRAVGCGAV